jgi:CheY-like chemotaxis protein
MKPLEGISIVLAEDDDDARDALRLALEARGASLRCVKDGAAALAAIRERPPDVVISDISMPGEDGHAFLKKLRALPPRHGGRTPAVALTAFHGRDARLASVHAGYHYHLTKPFDPDKLVEILVGLVRLTSRPRS